MANSQNGWPVVGKAACDQGPFLGVTFPNGILAGDVATIARWQLARYVALVEPLKAGTCWGWFDRAIRGATTKSNHASATAWDINADKYPLGAQPEDVMSAAKIKACRQIVNESGGVLRWGGNYSGRKDVMHWEINVGRTTAASFAARIRAGDAPGQEEHVDAKDAQLFVDTLLNTVLDTPYDTKNPKRKVRDLIRYIPSRDTVAGQVETLLAPRFALLSNAVANVARVAGQPVDLSDSDVAQIVSGLLAGLPPDLAQKIAKAGVDEAGRRLVAHEEEAGL